MKIRPDKQAEWDKCKANNSDPYGGAVITYLQRWADYMERDMAHGKALEDIAKPTSHEANEEQITGFMYGAAVSILARCWEHGEQLRRWHNLATQLKDEGERANTSGGVLNPAIMEIGDK